ncbi:MAG TPA: PAS domain-containing protein [Gallionella sp.]|nr:PAS domain-containing protein [Gallionella sp.]
MSDFLAFLKKQKKEPHQSAVWLLGGLTVSVFLIEALVMLLLDMLPAMSNLAIHLLDSTLLSILLFPIFYFFVFRPLLRNISELSHAKDELRVASVAFDVKEPILITDAQGNIIRANKMFLNITGYSLEELVGKNPRIFQTGRQGKAFYEQMWKQLLRTGSWSGEVRVKGRGGHAIPLGVSITAIKNELEQTTHYVAVYSFN